MPRRLFMLIIAAAASVVCASLPRIAVYSHNIGEEYPADEMIAEIENVLDQSGRFEVVDTPGFADSAYVGDNIVFALREMAADGNIDVFLLVSCGIPTERDRTISRNDSLITYRTVTVDVSGRFYSSSGSLIGTIRETGTSEGQLPYLPDVGHIALRSTKVLAERCLHELFPIEVSFQVGAGPVYTIPEGAVAGLKKGMVLSVVACSEEGFPASPEAYDLLRSRGVLQVMEITPSESSGRLLSGYLARGGEVIAVEQGSPAIISLNYNYVPCAVEQYNDAEQSEPFENTEVMNQVNLGGRTCKWGFGFGGEVYGGTIPHLSSLGVRLTAGSRIPLSSPSAALRLSVGSDIAFIVQDVTIDSLSSAGSAVILGGIADIDFEWLMSNHLGLLAGVSGRFGTAADSWTVQDYYGYTRDANPWEVYYSSFKPEVVSAHLGLFYMMY